jgi:pilus assembly protein Flp/PilA
MKRSYFPVMHLFSMTQLSPVVKRWVIRFLRDEQGQDLVEYALIVAAIGLALVATVNQLSVAIVSLYSSITQGLASIGAGGA